MQKTSKQSGKQTAPDGGGDVTATVDDFVKNVADKPSTAFHGDLHVVRLYCDDSLDPHVYEHVKHAWYKNNGQTLCICHFYDDGRYRFVMFQSSSIRWWQIWPERFETR